MKRPYNIGLINVCVVATIGLQATTGFVVQQGFRRLSGDDLWVSHTSQVIHAVDQTQNLLISAESGQRGFLLAGEPAYLEPYRASVAAIDRHFAGLKNLVVDNATQTAALNRVKPLIDGKLRELGSTLAVDRERAVEIVETGEGRRFAEQIHAALDEVGGEEQRLLQVRIAAQDNQSFLLLLYQQVSQYVCTALLLGLLWLTVQSNREARDAARA